MKKVLLSIIGTSLLTTLVFAQENTNIKDNAHMMQNKKEKTQNSHSGDHMHNGKMMNHSNPKGMTDSQMSMMKNKNDKSKKDHM